jgi:hypothetical protein
MDWDMPVGGEVLRGTLMRIIFTGFFFAATTLGQNATADAKNALAAECFDTSIPYPEWDAQAKRPSTTPPTYGAVHCLTALELATRAQPDKEGALQELISASPAGKTPYDLPPELQNSLWDWLPKAARDIGHTSQGVALDQTKIAINGFYSTNKTALLAVHSDIQKKNEPRVIYGLQKLAGANVVLMEQFRLSYAYNKQTLFQFVEEKFK